MAERAGREIRSRRGPDVLTLLVGVLTLTMALSAFVGEMPNVSLDPRWLLAGGAVLVGLLMLAGSRRRSRRRT